MDTLLSICIVVYKGYTEAIEAIRSIENCTDTNIKKKVFIVDNSPAGIEGVTEFLEDLKTYEDIEYIQPGENIGFGKGHNSIISKLDSQFHAIVNPDILLEEDVFSAMIDYLQDHKDVGMVIPRIVGLDGNLQSVYRKEPTVSDMFIRMFCKKLFPQRVAEHTLQDMNYSEPFQVPFGQGSFLVIRTELFKSLNGFDDRFFMYLEDADLCKRVNRLSKLMYVPDATVIHKWERGSHGDIRLFRIHLASMRQYFQKWGWKWK